MLIIIALYVRLNIDETPVFKEVKEQNHVVRAPLGKSSGTNQRRSRSVPG